MRNFNDFITLLCFCISEKLLEFNKKNENENLVLSDSQIENLVKTCEAGACCRMEDIETLNRLLDWPEGSVINYKNCRW